VKLLKKYENEKSDILYETCYLTLKLIDWKNETDNGKKERLNLQKLKFSSNDPAPPYNFIREQKYKDINYLESILLDNENYDLF
jgi:hypothetical protein